jgi:glyoxylase-like metal-dependent hydrolase (beta-lactamase superfamily II)
MKLTDKIHLLKLDFEITLNPQITIKRFVNSIIIFGEKITLIDTGVKSNEDVLLSYIKGNGRDITEIDRIILSHSHPDHIGCAAKLKKLSGCAVLAHRAERTWIENIETQAQERPVPGFFTLVDSSVQIDDFLNDGDELKVDTDCTLKIIHAPGHSSGSLNILFKDDRILFTADSIPLKNDIPNYDNYCDLLKSLLFIKECKDYDMLLTSWTPVCRGKDEVDALICEGESYMARLNQAVNEVYVGEESSRLEFCRKVILKLGLPDLYTMPIVDRAFRGHNA